MFQKLGNDAAWRHLGTREGFEVVVLQEMRRGWRLRGHVVAVEEARPWAVRYDIAVDSNWHTRRADVWFLSQRGSTRRTIRGDGSGRWIVDGTPAPSLDGCFDVDLEASACTNTLPVHRLELVDGVPQQAPAVYVRTWDLDVVRLEQCYTKRSGEIYDYEAPAFDFACVLRYDESGLVEEYPGIAVRVR